MDYKGDTLYRILALDDHPLVLEGMSHLVGKSSFKGVTSQKELLALLEQGRHYDLFILDLELPDADGFEAIKLIRSYCPVAAILIYTMHEEPWILARLANLDLQGVVSKSRPVADLHDAIMKIRQGQTAFDEAFLEVLEHMRESSVDTNMASMPAFQLSEREKQVLQCLSKGMTTQQISERLFISGNTVGTYRRRLMTKFDSHNVAQLINKARKYLEQ